MNKFKDIIKIAQQLLYCPICRRRYNIDEIKIRGWFDNIYFLQVDCANNHKPTSMLTVIVAKPTRSNTTQTLHDNTKINPNKQNIKNNQEPMLKALENFDGDFESLWKK